MERPEARERRSRRREALKLAEEGARPYWDCLEGVLVDAEGRLLEVVTRPEGASVKLEDMWFMAGGQGRRREGAMSM